LRSSTPRNRHTIALDVDHEALHFEIIAQCFPQQTASVFDLGVIHRALTPEKPVCSIRRADRLMAVANVQSVM
jgi:hypothetical protein